MYIFEYSETHPGMISQNELNALNAKIPKGYLWDGFWIDSFKRKVLNISASFDKMYYRDFMIVYKGVSFFNLPEYWRDTEVRGDFMYLETASAFATKFPSENIENKSIIAWKLSGIYDPVIIEHYYIVCDKVFVFKCDGEERSYQMDYAEPLSNKDFAANKFCNRVPLIGRQHL